MIVFARGSITNREALAPHREEEMRAVALLKADGVPLPFVVEGLMTVDYEETHEL